MEALPKFDRPIAHRGLHDRAAGLIENSAAAFDAAIGGGFAIECDLQLTGDGKAVVFHDDELVRLTGHRGRIRQLSAGQICRIPLIDSRAGDRPQQFEDMLEQVAGGALLVVEVKAQAKGADTADLAACVARAVSDYAGPLVLESFDPDMLLALRAAGVNRHLGALTMRHFDVGNDGGGGFSQMYLRHMMHWPMTRFSFISCHLPALNLAMVRFWRAWGMPVTTWTVHSQAEADLAAPHADQIVFEGFDPR